MSNKEEIAASCNGRRARRHVRVGPVSARTAPYLAIIAVLSAPVASIAQAPAGTQVQPAVVVTATRTPLAVTDLISDVSVVDTAALTSVYPGGLADILQRESGVEIATTGGVGSVTSLFIRGANTAQTQVRIDGFRIGSATLGQTTIEGLPANMFGRAEILRGPASSLYGADAAGGVVQLFLPRGEAGIHPYVSAGAGSYSTRAAQVGVSGGAGAVDYSLSFNDARSAGFNATKPGNFSYASDKDGYRRQSATANVNFRVDPRNEIGLLFFQDRLNSQFDDGDETDDARNKTKSQLVGIHSTSLLTDALTLKLRAGQTTDDNRSTGLFGGAFKTRQLQFGADTDYKISPAQLVSAGYERLEQRVDGSSFDPGTPGKRTTNAIRLAYFLDLKPHLLQVSVRNDDDTQYGSKATGNISYGYRLTDSLRVGGGFGTGYRAPSYNDLYFPDYGRPTIRPETSKNTELGAYYDQGNTSAKIVAYRNHINDLIVFNPVCPVGGFAFGCADNIGHATLEGVTLSGKQVLGPWVLSASADFQRPEDSDTGKLLPRRSNRHASVLADYLFGNARVGGELVASGRRFEDTANTQPLGGYAVVNLTGSYNLTRDWSLFARLNNLANRDYELAYQYATPGRNAFVGVSYRPR